RPFDATRGGDAEGDSRVEVPAGDWAESVCACDDREAECERYADEADAKARSIASRAEVGCEQRCPDTTEHEQERAEELGDESGRCRGHRFSSCISCHGLTFLRRSVRLKLAAQ